MTQRCGCGVDWSLAGHVQQLLLPKSSPQCSWGCVGVRNRMAASLGGDYFDFIDMSDGCQLILIGDVTGHGTHASVIMALLYGYLHRLANESCDPRLAVEQVNLFLQNFARRSVEYDHYFSSTLFYGILNPHTLTMSYVNAGHVAPMVRRGDMVLHLGSTTAPVGFFDHPDIEVHSFRFDQDDRLLLLTDGIVELEGKEGEHFGVARLERMLRAADGGHVAFLDHLFAQMDDFRGGVPPEDDCTAIVVDFAQQAAKG